MTGPDPSKIYPNEKHIDLSIQHNGRRMGKVHTDIG